ncbi:MAG: GIY-YIG nuclease family protein [Candidatus Magasanikbacteria bacterium]|nr:GIY-YIG nuclease family protein [Candidatus Magasanikbacteria bacterium]
MQEERYYAYLMANHSNAVLYVGVTSGLHKRVLDHKEGNGGYFTKKYNVNKLVYYEEYSHPDDAIAREKQIKNYSRKKKDELIHKFNPELRDLFNELTPW